MFDIKAHDATPAAPGELEILQRFLNLHEHAPGVAADLPASPDLVHAHLVERGLLDPGARYTEDDHARTMALHAAIHGLLRADEVGAPVTEHVRTIEDAAARAGLRVRFDAEEPRLEPTCGGVAGALGRLVAVLFLAELDGGWTHMKECASDTCTAVFYDRSKNRSGRWCSMQTCGNRHKVRSYRERHRTDAFDD